MNHCLRNMTASISCNRKMPPMMRNEAHKGNHCAKTNANVTAPKPKTAKSKRMTTKAKITSPITLLSFSNNPRRKMSYCVLR